MATFLDLSTKKANRARPDHKLMCEGCKLFTLHVFDHITPIGIRTVDVVYECSRCGEHRVFGREDTSSGKREDEDVSASAA